MKTPLLAVLALLSTLTVSGSADRRLSRLCTPVDTDRRNWVFVAAGETDDSPLYRTYGDTLLTEVLRGTRQWYTFRNDSCLYMGEESRLLKLTPNTPVPTSAFLHTRLGSVREVSDSGIYCSTYPLGSHGTYESALPREGILSIGDGREIPCRVVTETRRMSEPGDPAGDHAELEARRTRWFVEGDAIPVAFQVEERVICREKVVNSFTETYTLSVSDLEKIYDSHGVPPEETLAGLTIRNTEQGFTIEGPLPEGATLAYALSDINGIGVLSGELTEVTEGSLLEISVPTLPTGRYILSLGLRGANRRIFITRQ
ncbi:MAG: hypothetical protein K2H15_06420 [Muribaculaceae bacterium]|nr:hypothetical protein [Muribaculaceae bacterium]